MLSLAIVFIFKYYDNIAFITPMLTGKNAYSALGSDMMRYGFIIRLGTYILSVLLSLLIMMVVPVRHFASTKYGRRTLPIYFCGLPVYHITACY